MSPVQKLCRTGNGLLIKWEWGSFKFYLCSNRPYINSLPHTSAASSFALPSPDNLLLGLDLACGEFSRWAPSPDIETQTGQWPLKQSDHLISISEVVQLPTMATMLMLMLEGCSIMRGEQGLFLRWNPKDQGPGLMEKGLCWTVVTCIWTSECNLQYSGKSWQNRPGSALLQKSDRTVVNAGSWVRIEKNRPQLWWAAWTNWLSNDMVKIFSSG